jgi:hypothetical protein
VGTPFKSVVLPRNILDKMSERDRREYALHVGYPNAALTSSELEHKLTTSAENELQNQIRQFLNLKEIVFINPAMFRKSQLPEGWPDFTFAFCGIPILWECKSIAGKLRESQERIVYQLVGNGWRFRLIRSLEEARGHLRQIEIERLSQGKEVGQ